MDCRFRIGLKHPPMTGFQLVTTQTAAFYNTETETTVYRQRLR